MSETLSFDLELTPLRDYEFNVRFDWPEVPGLLLGGAGGPNAARLIAAGVANCLSASLVFCLYGRFNQSPGPLRTAVHGERDSLDHACYGKAATSAQNLVKRAVANTQSRLLREAVAAQAR